jgi:hypothetical protein
VATGSRIWIKLSLQWNWEEGKNKLIESGKEEQKSLEILRDYIVGIHKLSTAYLADLYYLSIDPNYEPRLSQLVSDFGREGLGEEWVQPYIEFLRNLQTKQQESYKQELQEFINKKEPTSSEPSPPDGSELVGSKEHGLNKIRQPSKGDRLTVT